MAMECEVNVGLKPADQTDGPGRYRIDRPAATLRGSVTESIRQMIGAGHFKPGERMPERELCELIGVSRTLVREALRQLETEGLIEVIPHRGPIVADITRDQAAGVYQVRAALEGLAARQFAQNATPAHHARLAEALGVVRAAQPGLDRLEAKNAFYRALVDGTGNEALGTVIYLINTRTMLLRGRSIQHPGRWSESLAELGALVAALKAGDGDAAADLAQQHVRNAAAAALETFDTP